ncbi:S8 family serine peptidase [Pseudoalteromonas obscura]|uniref:S8 family serine peptidase n=1 Tax=Pseudoalteromonas obscura TaxID=3048491 RepID=A0ABT7EQM7_9GAMM|nr:S8 family serine peptidase [Pseudoalteromonas sp. P94(2023)]MDK2597347.1 S8 family serine peptidase [Pseudoalteromonas sp. P94(2023)]
MKHNILTSTKHTLLALGVASALGATTAHAAASERMIVTLKQESMANALPVALSQAEMADFKSQSLELFANDINAQAIKTLPNINAVVMELTPEQLKQLEADGNVATVEVDPKRFVPEAIDASIAPFAESTPYGITMVQAQLVSDAAAANRKVCIMDTGYHRDHEDLVSVGVTGDDGYGSNDTGLWHNDGHGHGTHVAGTIAALGGNGTGVVGVNASGNLKLHIVKVFNDSGRWAYGSDLIEAINQCEAAGANVTSMSLGGSGSSTAERNAFDQSYQRGMLHIAAAGNGGNSALSYPASYDNVVSVAAVDSSENKASFSQYNSQVEIAGPGVGVNSTWNNGGYRSISGTSMATPHVSGVAALVWSNFPQCSNAQIRAALNATAKDKGAAGRDTSYGHGIVQAKAAYDYLAQSCGGGVDPAPVANFTFSTSGLTATFTNGSTAGTYNWTFGDGNSSSQSSLSHTYAQAGSYDVTLKVTNSAGDFDTVVKQVTVEDAVTPPGCSGLSAWSASTFYRVGDRVSYKGYEYKSTWWSRGAQPDIFSNVWNKVGKCN